MARNPRPADADADKLTLATALQSDYTLPLSEKRTWQHAPPSGWVISHAEV